MTPIPFKKEDIDLFINSFKNQFLKHFIENKIHITASLYGDDLNYFDFDIDINYIEDSINEYDRSFFKNLNLCIRVLPDEYSTDHNDNEIEYFLNFKATKNYLYLEVSEYLSTHLELKSTDKDIQLLLNAAEEKVIELLKTNKCYNEIIKGNKLKNF